MPYDILIAAVARAFQSSRTHYRKLFHFFFVRSAFIKCGPLLLSCSLALLLSFFWLYLVCVTALLFVLNVGLCKLSFGAWFSSMQNAHKTKLDHAYVLANTRAFTPVFFFLISFVYRSLFMIFIGDDRVLLLLLLWCCTAQLFHCSWKPPFFPFFFLGLATFIFSKSAYRPLFPLISTHLFISSPPSQSALTFQRIFSTQDVSLLCVL